MDWPASTSSLPQIDNSMDGRQISEFYDTFAALRSMEPRFISLTYQ